MEKSNRKVACTRWPIICTSGNPIPRLRSGAAGSRVLIGNFEMTDLVSKIEGRPQRGQILVARGEAPGMDNPKILQFRLNGIAPNPLMQFCLGKIANVVGRTLPRARPGATDISPLQGQFL